MSDNAQQPTPQQPVVPQTVAPQRPVWAAQPTQLVWQESPPLEYHQLFRGTAKYSWWRTLLALLLGTTFYLVFSLIFAALVLWPYSFFTGIDLTLADIAALSRPDTQEPVSLLFSLGSVATLLPAVWLALVCAGLRPAGRIWSAALKIRWAWLAKTLIPAVVSLVVANVVGIGIGNVLFALDGGFDAESVATEPTEFVLDPTIMLWSLLFIVLLPPLQATAEEVVFRGAFMQALGAWCFNRGTSVVAKFVRGPWIPIVLPSVLFGFLHIYDIWGWLSVVSLALVAGWISWRTGGLEAAISLHVINNWMVLSLMLVAFGGSTGQTAESGGWPSFVALLAGLTVYAWWIERIFKRSPEKSTRVDFIAQEIPVKVEGRA